MAEGKILNLVKDISRRKGVIGISQEHLFPPNEKILKMIFNEFFPIGIEPAASAGEIVYIGYSPHFREIEDTEQYPIYGVNAEIKGEEYTFKGMNEYPEAKKEKE